MFYSFIIRGEARRTSRRLREVAAEALRTSTSGG